MPPEADIFDMNIFEESDYKNIIKLIVDQRPEQKRGFFSRLAEHLNINPSLISQILSGPKDFTEEQIVQVCEYMGLSHLESRYILTLLQIERAGSHKLKVIHEATRDEIKNKALDLSNRIEIKQKLSASERSKFYSSWAYSAIHLMTTLQQAPQFKDICERFSFSSERTQEIINFLLETGMVIEKNSKYYPGSVHTHLEKTSPEVTYLHKNWRLRSIETAERLTAEEFMYSCNFTISKKDFLALREELVQVTKKFLRLVDQSHPEDLAQLNIDLFWLRS